MRIIISLTAFCIIVFTLSAQVPVKKDLMQMLEKIPPPPSTVKDSYTKISINKESGDVECSAEKLFKSIEQDINGVIEEFESQPRPDVSSAVPGISSEDAQKMNNPDMKKKMKKMSKEEKMKMAMEMMNSMSAGTPAAEADPPLVREAVDEWQKIYNNIQDEFQRSVSEQQQEVKAVEEYENSQSKLDSLEAAEIGKLPRISSGEMDAPDPAKVKAVKLKFADKHIAAANKRLEQIRVQWRQSSDQTKAKYKAFYRKLIAADYAAGSKNFPTKKILADAQISILKIIQHRTNQSRKAWEESASWQARRVNIENQ